VSFCVLFVCICVLYYCHQVATQLQLNIYIYIYNKTHDLNTFLGKNSEHFNVNPVVHTKMTITEL
jgi:hypothetical protein